MGAEWLQKNNNCPVCRYEFPKKEEETPKVASQKIEVIETNSEDKKANDNIKDETDKKIEPKKEMKAPLRNIQKNFSEF